MELHLMPETLARLNELAQRTHRGTDELLAEALDEVLGRHGWLDRLNVGILNRDQLVYVGNSGASL